MIFYMIKNYEIVSKCIVNYVIVIIIKSEKYMLKLRKNGINRELF